MSSNEPTDNTPASNQHGNQSGGQQGARAGVRAWSTAELLELSTLDALGLLDEQERRTFEEGFAAATPAVKAMLRAHQSLELRAHAAQLSEGVPAVSLRQRVIDAVLGAARGSAPRGVVGVPTAGAVLARIGPELNATGVASADDELAELDRLSRLAEGGRSRRVNPLWRAAAIGCMAAAVLFGVVSVQLWGDFRRLDGAIRNNTVAEVFAKEFGPRFEHALMSPRTRFVQFAAQTPAVKGEGPQAVAVMLIDQDGKAGQFFARDLPQNTPLTLSVVSPDGKVRTAVLSFVATDTRATQQLADMAIPDGAWIELHASAEQAPLLKSFNL